MTAAQRESYARALRADIRNWRKVRDDWIDRTGDQDSRQVAECNDIIHEARAELAELANSHD